MAESWKRLAGAALLLVLVASVQAAPPRSDTSRLSLAHVRKPLTFEPNRGQSASRCDFVARGPDYTVALSAGRATLKSDTGDDIRLVFVGAKSTRPQPLDLQNGTVDYYGERDPSRSVRELPTYGRIRYPGAYRGIDIVYYGHHGELEFDLDVAPGADPSMVRLRVEGAGSMHVDENGALRIAVTGDEIRIDPPVVYQRVEQSRTPVSATWVIESGNELSIALGKYEPARRIMIE